jgi:hypothetical protein
VDNHGIPVGTLSCYWESSTDVPAFYGVKLKRKSDVHVVPVRSSQKNERHSCIQLGFSAEKVEAAPVWDCSMELDAYLQEKVNVHYGLAGVPIQPRLKHFARKDAACDTSKRKSD